MVSVRKRHLLGFGVLIVEVLAFLQSAEAQDLVSSRALIENLGGTLSLGDVIARPGTGIGREWKMGSTDAVHWVRLQVRAPAHGNKVVLFIRPSYLNEVRLFEPDASVPAGWRTRVTGNVYPFAERDRARTSLGFVVQVSAPVETFYLRIKTRSPSSLQVEGLEPEEADRRDHQRDLLGVFFVTAMAFLLLWAVHTYFLDRQPVVGFFALHQATYTLFGIAATGYLARLNPPGLPHLVDWVNAILYLAINLTCALFCRALLKPYGPPHLAKRLLDILPWAFPILLAAFVTGHDSLAVNCNAVLIKLSLLFYLVTTFLLRTERVPSRRVLQAFFSAIVVFNLLFWFAGRFGEQHWNVSLSAIQALVFDGFVFGALFTWVLHANARQALCEGHEAAMQLLLVQKKFELEQELKKQMEVQAQTDYLTGLCNRRHFVELAENELSRAIRYGSSLSILVIDIDHFKRINDTWGHAAGDAVLLQVSEVIRESLRCNDILARTGGEEFGALLPETAESEALIVAERVCSTVANAVMASLGPERIRVTVSIGLAGINEQIDSLDAAMLAADQAMYRAKQAGRNCVCSSTAVAQAATDVSIA